MKFTPIIHPCGKGTQFYSAIPSEQILKQISLQTLRSNQYFNISRLQDPSPAQSSKVRIKLQGLIEPSISHLQIYRLLNPFDTTVQHKPIQNPFDFSCILSSVSDALQFSSSDLNKEKQSTNNVPIQSSNTKRTRHRSNSQSCMDETQKSEKQLDMQNFITNCKYLGNKSSQQTKAVQHISHQDKNETANSLSEIAAGKSKEFLQKKKIIQDPPKLKNQQNGELKKDELNVMFQNFSIWYWYYAIRIMNQKISEFQKRNESLQLLKFTLRYRELDLKLLLKNIQNLVLFSLYHFHDIKNKWTQSFKNHLKELKINYPTTYLILKKLSKNVVEPKLQKDSTVKTNIIKTFEERGINLEQLDKVHEFKVQSNEELPPSIQVINFLINNLHKFKYQSKEKNHNIFKSIQNCQSQLADIRINLQISYNDDKNEKSGKNMTKYENSIQISEEDRRGKSHKNKGKEENGIKSTQKENIYLSSSQHGLINSKIQNNKVTFLNQLVEPMKTFRNEPQFLIEEIVKRIKEYSDLIDLTGDQDMKAKKPLIPINSRTLIWNSVTSSIEIDKLETMKLFFDLQNHPKPIDQNLKILMDHPGQQPSSSLESLLNQIYYEQYTLEKQFPNNTTEKSQFLSMIPYVKVLAILYEIFHKSQNHLLDQSNTLFNQQSQKDNLIELMIMMRKMFDNLESEVLSQNQEKIRDQNKKERSDLEKYMQEIVKMICKQKAQ